MAVAMLLVAWKTSPSRGGKTAPPMIAITISDPPSFVLGPNPLIPRAKIVGNIKDMKKLVRKIAHTLKEVAFRETTARSETPVTSIQSWKSDLIC